MEAQELTFEERTRRRGQSTSDTSSVSSGGDIRVLSPAGEPAQITDEIYGREVATATRWLSGRYCKNFGRNLAAHSDVSVFKNVRPGDLHRFSDAFVHTLSNTELPKRNEPFAWVREEASRLVPGGFEASPFDVLSAQKSEALSDSIERLRALRDCQFANAIADRIDDLVSMSLEDEPDHFPLEPSSVDTFRQLLTSAIGIGRPNLALTPNRTLQARWMNSPSEKLSVEFRTGREVKFVLFTPDPEKARMRDYLTGTRTARSLARLIEQLGVIEWMGRKDSGRDATSGSR